MANTNSILKSRDITLSTKVYLVKAMVFPVVVYECESWTKEWCFWTVAMEKALESPLDCKEIRPVNPKGNQSWIFIGRTDAGTEAPILWPPDAKNWIIWNDPKMLGKIEGGRRRETTEDEMVRWHHQLDGHEFEQALGVGDGQGSLACCSLWGHKELDMTERLNWAEQISRSYQLTAESEEELKSLLIWVKEEGEKLA